MLSSLAKLFTPAPQTSYAHDLYIAIVTQSRNPFFYSRLAVSDDIDGRFEMIVLHMFILIRRLRTGRSPESLRIERALVEALFDDMDRSLREMGVGDTGVGRRIRHMADAFYGRVHAYEASISDPAGLRQALARNLYGGDNDIPQENLRLMAEYVTASIARLENTPLYELKNRFPLPLPTSGLSAATALA